jgi:hypothetical protein
MMAVKLSTSLEQVELGHFAECSPASFALMGFHPVRFTCSIRNWDDYPQ